MSQKINIDALVNEICDLQETEKTIKEKIAILRQKLSDQLDVGKHEYAGCTITKSKPRKTLNTIRLTQTYPVTKHPEFYTPKIDTKQVKQHLSPTQLEEGGFYDIGEPTLTIKVSKNV